MKGEGQYSCLSNIEKYLSSGIHRTMNREDENYLNKYPLYSDFIDCIYKRGFRVIYIILVTIKTINECLTRKYSLSFIFEIPCVIYNGQHKWTACTSFKELLSGNDLFEDYMQTLSI